MPQHGDDISTFTPVQLYAAVQQFYAHQMGMLDDGAVDAWADSFTEDAVFEDATAPEPLRGRGAIIESVRSRVKQIEAENREFRHWFGMIDVEPQKDGSLHTRLYALAMSTPAGGTLNIHGHVVCRDQLVPDNGGWLVRRRQL